MLFWDSGFGIAIEGGAMTSAQASLGVDGM
jgi:hypothetical protein